MLLKKAGIIAILICLGILHQGSPPGICEERGETWYWFSALSLKNDWTLLGGPASVVIDKGKITAELYDTDGFHGMSLKGTITAQEFEQW